MTATRFDPAHPLAAGRTVIEASAGTGKTFTIAGIVTRLVAVDGYDIEDIVVVTFTVAATAELRRRIRDRLQVSARALEGGPADPDDDHLAALLDATAAERTARARKLRDALAGFDRAQVSTIHGFAQGLVGRLGLLSRLPADLDPGEPDSALVAQVAADLVVGRFASGTAGQLPMTPSEAASVAGVVLATPDATMVPDPADAGAVRPRVELVGEVADEAVRRMRRAGTVTFDDGLAEVRAALADPEVGEAARDLLRSRYRVALVDESQDTDPVQWDVIRRVFDGLTLVVIGDPKQSIYSFRAADVETYLAARRDATVHTLETNWRSDGPLLEALDTLFAGATFGDAAIGYVEVGPCSDHERARIHGAGAPLTIRRFAGDLPIDTRNDGYYAVGPLREQVAADAAAEVVRLIAGEVTVDAGDGRRPLGPGDVAVLCRTRKQVDLMRAALARCRVPSVAARSGGVFASPVAEEWRRFLLAVERPDRIALVRLAAGTQLIGHSLADVAAMADAEVLDLQHRVGQWQEMLADGGVPKLIAQLDRETGLVARVLALPDGERLMTDVTHVAEELHAVWRRGRVASLAGWLEAAIAEASRRELSGQDEPEERQRRLETDAAAVAVHTVHGAKGLEFPVVLVPFAWDVWIPEPPVPVFHDPGASGGDGPRRRLADVAGKDHPGFADHAALTMAEAVAEEGRLLYVALTRARHHLVTWWIENHAKVAETKIHELVTGGGRTPEDLVAAGSGTIAMPVVTGLPTVTVYEPPQEPAATLEPARFDRRLDATWQRASFSSLSPEHPLASPDDQDEPGGADEPEVDEPGPEPVPGAALPLAEMPRGARFGILVHHVFEHARLDAPDLTAELRRVLDTELARSGWEFDATAFVAGMAAAVTTPLGPAADDVRLSDLGPGTVLDELRFELPVRSGSAAISLRDVGAVMLDHLPAEDPYRAYAADLEAVEPRLFRGYLTGAIDVTAAVPGSEGRRYVVMDYKSNAMRTLAREASPLDYGPVPLAAAMVDGHYVLQATLYQVALHRYLQWRLTGYDPERHLGGAAYLFVRGMVGPETPVVEGERCGVARWRPPPAMVVALSRLFAGDGR